MASLELHCPKGAYLFYTCSPINAAVGIPYVFCIFTVYVWHCVSSLLIFALFYCLHVERYPDCQAVSDRSTLCGCFILYFIVLTIREHRRRKLFSFGRAGLTIIGIIASPPCTHFVTQINFFMAINKLKLSSFQINISINSNIGNWIAWW